jgi:hypothetical protein
MRGVVISAFVLACIAGQAGAANFAPFKVETQRFKAAYQCPQSKVTGPMLGDGSLFGCVSGAAQTAKYFINETPKGGRVENVKVMWNDWFDDIGYGLHADRNEAFRMVDVLAALYAPAEREHLRQMFESRKDKKLKANGFTFSYTYRRGPKIDERLIVVTQ